MWVCMCLAFVYWVALSWLPPFLAEYPQLDSFALLRSFIWRFGGCLALACGDRDNQGQNDNDNDNDNATTCPYWFCFGPFWLLLLPHNVAGIASGWLTFDFAHHELSMVCPSGLAARGTLITHAWQVGRRCFWALFKTFTSTHTHAAGEKMCWESSGLVGAFVMHCTRFACTSERPQLLNPHGAGGCPKTHVPTQTRTPRYTHTHVRACVCVCWSKVGQPSVRHLNVN